MKSTDELMGLSTGKLCEKLDEFCSVNGLPTTIDATELLAIYCRAHPSNRTEKDNEHIQWLNAFALAWDAAEEGGQQ